MMRTLKLLAAGVLGVSMTMTAAAADDPHHPRPPAPHPAPAPRPAPKPAPRPAPVPKPAPRPAPKPAPVPKPVPVTPVKPTPKPAPLTPKPPVAPAKPVGPGTTTPKPPVTPRPPVAPPTPGTITTVNRNSNTNITTINNTNTTTITTRPTPRDGRGPVVVVGGRGRIVDRDPRFMPGLVGGTVVAAGGGFVPAAADPAVVQVPVYTPTPVAAADPAPVQAVAAEPAAAEPEVELTPRAPALRLSERRLRVKNNTGEGLTVYVQHLSRTGDGRWAWLPADPRADAKAEEYRVDAGADAVLATKAGPLTARAVRLWAVSDSGREWADYKAADLPLVPETDAAGNHVYFADAVGTFTLAFDK